MKAGGKIGENFYVYGIFVIYMYVDGQLSMYYTCNIMHTACTHLPLLL